MAAPASAQPAAPLTLTALSFSKSSVDATGDTAKAVLHWAISDTAGGVTSLKGTVYLAVPGSKPGTFSSATVRVPFSFPGTGAIKTWGSAHDSRYNYLFHVPEYAQLSPAAWQVVKMTVSDNEGDQAKLTGSVLTGFGAVLSATEVVATSPPTYQDLSISENESPARPYLYVPPHKAGVMDYEFNVQDYPAGIASGSLQVKGPGGVTITTPFSYNAEYQECGYDSGGDPTDMMCGVGVSYPPGVPAGNWVVSRLTLVDAAGNRAIYRDLDAAPITVTSNQVMKASHFTASPNPVNDWAPGQYTVQISMTVTGAVSGVSAVYVDTAAEGSNCMQDDSTPTVNGDTVSVPIVLDQNTVLCQITGIAIVDGAGDLSLYAMEYSAPDPDLLVRQLPDTTPPTATAASISPTSIPSSQTNDNAVDLTIAASTVIAPIAGLDIRVYNAAGTKVLWESGGGASEYQGSVTGQLPLPYDAPPGTYLIGFTLVDAGQLSTSYGPKGEPMPGGPLQLTITSG